METYVTLNEFCKYFGIGRTLGSEYVHTKGFPHIKMGREYRIKLSEAEKWFKSRNKVS